MANEAEIINNPDSTPGAVSTGYQAQNTNLVSQRTGIDKTYVSGGVGTVTVEISGPVDVNGVLYDIKSQTVLTPTSAGRYYITLQGAGPQYLTPTLSEVTAGYAYWSALKNAYYTVGDEYRVLDWLVDFDGTDCRVYRRGESRPEIMVLSSGIFVAPWSQFYSIEMCGRGGNGGSGSNSGILYSAGGGGGSGSWGILENVFLSIGHSLTASFSSSSGGNITFADGIDISLSVQNGYYANLISAGAAGVSSSGFHKGVSGYQSGAGGSGGNNVNISGGKGGDSFPSYPGIKNYGVGGAGGSVAVGGNGLGYGSGGGGGGAGPSGNFSGGTGAPGYIKIMM